MVIHRLHMGPKRTQQNRIMVLGLIWQMIFVRYVWECFGQKFMLRGLPQYLLLYILLMFENEMGKMHGRNFEVVIEVVLGL